MKNTFLFLLFATALLTSACNKESQDEIDDQLIQDYLTSNNIDAQEASSGLYYVIDVEGTGTAFPDLGDQVKVEYTGRLLDGTQFDSNVGSDIIATPLVNFIRGWHIGIPKFKRNAEGRLFIPSRLAYGSNERPGLPGNSILVFDIRIINFY